MRDCHSRDVLQTGGTREPVWRYYRDAQEVESAGIERAYSRRGGCLRNKRIAFSSEMSEEQASAKEGKRGYHGARTDRTSLRVM